MNNTSIRLLAQLTRVQAEQRSHKVAIVFAGRELTFGDLDRRANKVANGLIREKVTRHARIALLDKNTDCFFEILFGSAKAGTVLVTVNWRLAPTEILEIINDAQPELLFVGHEFLDLVERMRPELKTVKNLVVFGSSHFEWDSYAAWLDRQHENDPVVPLQSSDVVLQLYTSGTTGHPKGVQLTNDSILSLAPVLNERGNWNEKDVSLVCLPLFHVAGSLWGVAGLYAGAKNVILRETIPSEILRSIADYGVTKTFLVPALILVLLQTSNVEEVDLSSLNLVVYGASPIPVELLRRGMSIFACDFGQVYGLTETAGAITYLPPEDHTPQSNVQRLLSCGKPLDGVQIKVVDGEGNEMPFGRVGHIICRTSKNMKGYWNLPEATGETIRGGWLYTGDAGYFDSEGYLYIQDRIDDMIITGGENVYPAEVENVLFSHPAVADAAVIGVPDDRWGETVKAIIVKKPDAEVKAEDLIAFAREHIAGFKVPTSVDFVDALKRNASGKIVRREIRLQFGGGLTRNRLDGVLPSS